MSYLYVFLQSNLLEIAPYYVLLPRGQRGWGLGQMLVLITLLNSLTHPIVFFGIMNLRFSFLTNILLAEGFAIVSETILLARALGLSWRSTVVASLVANLLSWQLAPALTYLVFS